MRQGMLTIVEDEEFYFDEEAADKPCRFIETLCRHRKGAIAGQPFILHPIQKEIIRDVYGWKHRSTGLRRFNEVFWSGAVGCGKSPLLAAIGLYELVDGGEPAAELFSLASTFSQARIVFDNAKNFIDDEPRLRARCSYTQYEIQCGQNIWRIVSGKPKAGAGPHAVYGDEVHEWPNREIYDSYHGRMGKRRQPIFWAATNAGTSRQSLCWQLHEQAVAVLEGKSNNKELYPIIWEAPKEAPIDDPATWKLANPLLGVTVSESKVRTQWEGAQGIPALEARFRRLNCGQWVQGSSKWLKLDQWDSCIGTFNEADVANHGLYVAVDGSEGDDLYAVVNIYAGERFYVDSHFYLPRPTAEHYDQKNDTNYIEWSTKKHLTLLDEPTITPTYQRTVIAAKIIELHNKHPIKAVCYDRSRVDALIDELEKAGIVCLPIAQGYTVSPGCRELDRRLKEGSITIISNPVLDMCAENVEVKSDDRGNIWPVKQRQKGEYAGTKSMKIDGIQALVTALTEARKHDFGSKTPWIGAEIV